MTNKKRLHIHIHIHMSVKNIEESITFYSAQFQAEPTKVKEDYAQWLVDDLSLNFAISTRGYEKEVMQEVALKIFSSLHLQKEHLRRWLYTLTKNTITDYYRKNSKPPIELEEETELEPHILSECLTPVLNSLKPQEKEMLELTQLQEYSLKEVATQKGIPLNTAKSQLFRAKEALASAFFSCCNYERNSRGEIVDFDGCGC